MDWHPCRVWTCVDYGSGKCVRVAIQQALPLIFVCHAHAEQLALIMQAAHVRCEAHAARLGVSILLSTHVSPGCKHVLRQAEWSFATRSCSPSV